MNGRLETTFQKCGHAEQRRAGRRSDDRSAAAGSAERATGRAAKPPRGRTETCERSGANRAGEAHFASIAQAIRRRYPRPLWDLAAVPKLIDRCGALPLWSARSRKSCRSVTADRSLRPEATARQRDAPSGATVFGLWGGQERCSTTCRKSCQRHPRPPDAARRAVGGRRRRGAARGAPRAARGRRRARRGARASSTRSSSARSASRSSSR